MKKRMVLLVLILIAGMFLGGCVTFAQKAGIPQKTVAVLAFVPTVKQPTGEIIANYWNFIGFNINYKKFVESIEGRDYDLMIKNYCVVTEIIAYSTGTKETVE